MKARGQVSWIWAVVVSFIGLVIFTGFWIVTNEAQNKMHTSALANGVNADNLATFESFWKYLPVAVLFSFGLYVIVIALSSQGGGMM